MKKIIRTTLILAALMWFSLPCMAKECQLTSRQIDVYLHRLETTLPVLEKQAAVIIDLLQNDKDLNKIREELERFQGYTDLPAELTPLYNALEPFKPNDDFILIGKNYIPLYSIQILHDLANGGCYRTISYAKALENTPPQQWERIDSIMEKMLQILSPLNDVIVEKLSHEDAMIPREWRCELSGERLAPAASCLYSVMFNVTDATVRTNSPIRYYTNERERKRIMRIMAKAETPILHLEMIKKYFRYLSKRRGNTDWETLVATIDQMINDMAQRQNTISDL